MFWAVKRPCPVAGALRRHGRGDGCGRDIAIKPFGALCWAGVRPGFQLAAWRYWGEGRGRAGSGPSPCARRCRPGAALASSRRPTGPAAGSAAVRTVAAKGCCRRGIPQSEPTARNQRVLCTGSGHRPGWRPPVPGHRFGQRPPCDESSLQVEGQTAKFSPAGDCGPDPIRQPRPPSGVWAVRAEPVLATNHAAQLEPGGTPLRRWLPQRQALRLLAPALEIRQEQGRSTQGGRVLGAPWPWARAGWLWRWTSTPRSALHGRLRRGGNGPGRPVGYRHALPDGWCRPNCRPRPSRVPVARLAAWPEASQAGSAPAQTAERRGDHRGAAADGSRCCRASDGSPPWDESC